MALLKRLQNRVRSKIWVWTQAIGAAIAVYGVHELWGDGMAALIGGALLIVAGTLGEAQDTERRPAPVVEGEGDGTRTPD